MRNDSPTIFYSFQLVRKLLCIISFVLFTRKLKLLLHI